MVPKVDEITHRTAQAKGTISLQVGAGSVTNVYARIGLIDADDRLVGASRNSSTIPTPKSGFGGSLRLAVVRQAPLYLYPALIQRTSIILTPTYSMSMHGLSLIVRCSKSVGYPCHRGATKVRSLLEMRNG